MISRADILAAIDRTIEPFEVAEWGGSIFLRSLTVGERFSFLDLIRRNDWGDSAKADLASMQAHLIALCVCDAGGVALFTLEDVQALKNKDCLVIDRVFSRAQIVAGLVVADPETTKKN